MLAFPIEDGGDDGDEPGKNGAWWKAQKQGFPMCYLAFGLV
jgi:hypothetical protein